MSVLLISLNFTRSMDYIIVYAHSKDPFMCVITKKTATNCHKKNYLHTYNPIVTNTEGTLDHLLGK